MVSEKPIWNGLTQSYCGTCGNLWKSAIRNRNLDELLQTQSMSRRFWSSRKTLQYCTAPKNIWATCAKISLFSYWTHLWQKHTRWAPAIYLCVCGSWDNLHGVRQSVDAEPAFFGVNHRDGSELEIPNKKNMFISICSRWLESEYWCFCRLKFEIYIRIYIYIYFYNLL